MDSDAPSGRIRDLLDPVVRAAGADLEAVAVTRAGRRSLVRITVDADGGLNLDQVAEISRVLSDALDSSDVMGADPWTLEVGTRGVATPLTLPRHWRRNVGRLVKVRGGLPTGEAEVVARIVAADEESATLRDDDTGAETVVALRSVNRAVVQVEFQRRDRGSSTGRDLPAEDDTIVEKSELSAATAGPDGVPGETEED